MARFALSQNASTLGDALSERHDEGDRGGGGAPLWHRRAGRPPSLEQKQKLRQSRARQPHQQQQQHPRQDRPQNQQNLLPLEQWTSEKQHGRSQV